jgi:hypothetical protein
MAGKPLNRLELRRQNDAAEPLDPMEVEADDLVDEPEDDDGQETRRPKKRKTETKKAKGPKGAKPAKPATRLRIVWTVMNDAFKPVATFEYAQKEAALTRAAELTAKGKGPHFVQKTKEPMPDNAPGLGAQIPRTAAQPTEAVVKEVAAAVEDEEELEDEEEEADLEMDEEPEEEDE